MLRMVIMPRYGTKRGDVYSFAIIVQEIVLVDSPFAIELRTYERKGMAHVDFA